RIDVDADGNLADIIVFDGGVSSDIDVAQLRLKHQFVGQHVIGPNLEGQAKAAVEATARHAIFSVCCGQLIVEEDGVIDAGAYIGFEGRVACQRVINGAESWRQMCYFA